MHLIHRAENGRWVRSRIPEAGCSLVRVRRGDGSSATRLVDRDLAGALARVVTFVDGGVRCAALVCRPFAREVAVAGSTPLGVTVLRERAELLIAGERLYFTEREPLRPQRFVPADDAAARCRVCDGDLEEGASVIRCTRCHTTSHEDCFAHQGDQCAGCGVHRREFEWMPPEDDRW
jgi:hypothetical protein